MEKKSFLGKKMKKVIHFLAKLKLNAYLCHKWRRWAALGIAQASLALLSFALSLQHERNLFRVGVPFVSASDLLRWSSFILNGAASKFTTEIGEVCTFDVFTFCYSAVSTIYLRAGK